jgi:outer membrane immunogenic protein
VHKTKKSLLASMVLGALGSTGAALAADMPVKAPVAAAASVYNWSGFYIGGHAGYGIGMNDYTDSSFFFQTKGFLAGGQIGFNQQSGNVVFGIEADASWANIKGDQTLNIGGPLIGFAQTGRASTEIDSLVSVAGRFGFAQDHWLVYLKAGVAWAHMSHTFGFDLSTFAAPPIVQTIATSHDSTRAGHLIGFGAEYAIGGNWSAKAEYNLVNFGDFAAWFTGTQTAAGVTTPFTSRILLEQSLHIVKVGVNYRFGTPSLLAQEPPARPSEGFNWTGAYVGAVAGYGIGRKDWSDIPEQFDVRGALAGGTAGANVHVGLFVFGVEGEWMWTNIKGGSTETSTAGGGLTQTIALATRVNWLATAAARVGVVTIDRWLNYVKVGFALADETHDLRFDQAVVGVGSTSSDFSGDRLHTGFLIGVGTEYAFFSNWSVKAEYNYMQFAQQTTMLTGIQSLNIPPAQVGSIANFQAVNISQQLHLFKVGLNYHFNSLDVVRARY